MKPNSLSLSVFDAAWLKAYNIAHYISTNIYFSAHVR